MVGGYIVLFILVLLLFTGLFRMPRLRALNESSSDESEEENDERETIEAQVRALCGVNKFLGSWRFKSLTRSCFPLINTFVLGGPSILTVQKGIGVASERELS